MKTIYTDALVIGGGLAGLRTAIGVRRRGHEVIVLSLVPPKRSHSAAAQGGMQASLGNTNRGQGDNEDIHFADTVKGSDWGCDQDVARMFVDVAPKAVRELAAWGVPWGRVERGSHDHVIDGKNVPLAEREHAHGLIAARNFGGTQKWRTCYVADGTGHSMLYTMSNQAIAENIQVHERMEAIALIHDGERCYGAVVRNLKTGELVSYIAKASCIATGGYGRIYQATTNAVINEGMGTAIALETGVAALGNMEAVQFHPTGIFPAGILVTEGCRGDGGLLLDRDLKRFMPDYEPEKKELASRDVVARWMEHHIQAGKGVQSRFGEHLWLDIRLLGKKHINGKLREVKEICQNFLGIDPVTDLIPVRPCQHYSMGGVRTNAHGESPQLKGLFAAGEAACWDMHGFNRLGGNSVAETAVAGMIVGETMADFIGNNANEFTLSTALVRDTYNQQMQRLEHYCTNNGNENPFHIMQAMQKLMSANVGIFRNAQKLQHAVNELKALAARARHIKVHGSTQGGNPEIVAAYRVESMLRLSLCVAQGALAREESRGAHYREDFTLRDDKNWLKRTLATWNMQDDCMPTLSYEALDVMTMEMPPGWRGYGAKDRIDHPDTAKRQAQVDTIKAKHNGGNRFDCQHELMPFKEKLPVTLRGYNQRLDDNDQARTQKD